MNDISQIFLFLPEGVKMDIENTKRLSDDKEVNGKKTAEVHDQFFLAAGIPAS
jgi:hypothetical protein